MKRRTALRALANPECDCVARINDRRVLVILAHEEDGSLTFGGHETNSAQPKIGIADFFVRIGDFSQDLHWPSLAGGWFDA